MAFVIAALLWPAAELVSVEKLLEAMLASSLSTFLDRMKDGVAETADILASV